MQGASVLTLYAILIVAVVQDITSMRISNRLIIMGLFLSMAFGIVLGGMPRIIQVLLNISIPVIMLYLFYLIGVLGAGDIKLFSVIGGFTNFCITFPFLLILVKERLQKAGDPMKLFKTTPQPPDGYAILLDNLKQTTAELQNTYANLENVVDPDLIDYYIYQAKAVQMRYKFLLGCVKKIEGNYSLPS